MIPQSQNHDGARRSVGEGDGHSGNTTGNSQFFSQLALNSLRKGIIFHSSIALCCEGKYSAVPYDEKDCGCFYILFRNAYAGTNDFPEAAL